MTWSRMQSILLGSRRSLGSWLSGLFIAQIALASPSGWACPVGRAPAVSTQDRAAARQLQRQALELRRLPSIVGEIDATRRQLASLRGAESPQAKASLERALDEMTFTIAQWSLAADPVCPEFSRVSIHPGRFPDGLARPGARLGFDNPDGIYWTAYVDPRYRYEISGKRDLRHPPTDQNFSVWSNRLTTLDNLTFENVTTDRNGSFRITLDRNPANGRLNHLQLKEGADTVMIRDTMADWLQGVAPSYSIRRVDKQEKSSPAKAFSAEQTMIEKQRFWTRFLVGLLNDLASKPVNSFVQPRIINEVAALVSQANTWGRIRIGNDEALVITVDMAGYRYFVLPVTDFWTITDDYQNIQRSLNNHQAISNPDGSYTFVLANRDPGYRNWIDTHGLPDATVMMRWQHRNSADNTAPRVTARLVKLHDLARALPAAFPKVTARERLNQMTVRGRGYERLFGE